MKSLIVLLAVVFGLTASNCQAGLCITLEETSTGGVEISWSGSGTLAGNPNSALGFNNFGDFFASVGGIETFTLASPLTLAVTTPFPAVTSFSTYSSIRLDDETSDNFNFLGGDSFDGNETYSASGTSVVQGLFFSQLTAGTYDDPDGVDVGRFGSGDIELKINAITGVPEPTSLTLFAIAVGCVIVPRKRRLRHRLQN